jgi:hypothetical protein
MPDSAFPPPFESPHSTIPPTEQAIRSTPPPGPARPAVTPVTAAQRALASASPGQKMLDGSIATAASIADAQHVVNAANASGVKPVEPTWVNPPASATPLVPHPPAAAFQTPQTPTGQPVPPVPASPAQPQPQRPARRVLLSQTEIEDGVGRSIHLTASVQDAHGKVIFATAQPIWSTTDPFVATVKSNGEVALVNRGKCVIVANMGGTMGSCAVTVH